MSLIIKTFSLIAILFCCGWNALPQSIEILQNQYANDPCGDPRVESSAWTGVAGEIVKVIDGNTIIMSLSKKKRLLVHLVGIDAPALNQPFGNDAQQFLERIVSGKKVEVWVNPSNWIFKRPRPKEITGIVYLRSADMQDVNLSLVRAGMVRHKESQPYTMSNYTECRYEKAEEEARAAKRGLWQGAP
jgi:endonuclease YncB( thermonuclease family)